MTSNHLKALIVGAGAAGLYLTEELQRLASKHQLQLDIDIINRDIRPGGLITYGVAPDHQKIRQVLNQFEPCLDAGNVRYFGNVTFGKDIFLNDIRSNYDLVVFCVGAQGERSLEVPGENLPGCYPASVFVGWYNGHPSYANLNPSLNCSTAVIFGAGNVAADVARVLLKSREELGKTDISSAAIRTLIGSRVSKVVVCVRRSPVYIKFTPSELRDLCALPNLTVKLNPDDFSFSDDEAAHLGANREAQKNIALLRSYLEKSVVTDIESESTATQFELEFIFKAKPTRFIGEVGLDAVELVKEGKQQIIPTGLAISAVGYRVVPLAEVPYSQDECVITNTDSRVQLENENGCYYTCGWAADGPVGIIGTNKVRAKKTVQAIEQDLQTILAVAASHAAASTRDLADILDSRKTDYVSKEEWKIINNIELERGKRQGKVRERFLSDAEMLQCLNKLSR